MMMRALPPTAATASDATTTSGFGSGLGSGGQSKNRRSYLKLILIVLRQALLYVDKALAGRA